MAKVATGGQRTFLKMLCVVLALVLNLGKAVGADGNGSITEVVTLLNPGAIDGQTTMW